MSRLARLTAALTLCALLAAPAAAQQFFTFEIGGTFNNVTIGGVNIDQPFLVTGRTTTALSGTPKVDATVTAPVQSMTLTYGGTEIGNFFSGDFKIGQTTLTANDPPVLTFNYSGSGDDFGVRAFGSNSFLFQMEFGGVQTWFGFGGGVNDDGSRLRLTTADEGTPEVPVPNVSQKPTSVGDLFGPGVTRNAILVPEINGSGFAYIAFILGALGLWLHSGAGRREPEGRLA